MAKRLDGRVAIVCGAGAIAEGMSNGRAAAISYAREGAKVLAVDMNLDSAVETQRQIEAEGGFCAAFAADMSKSQDVQKMIAFSAETFGPHIHVLHNNIGIVSDDWVADLDEEIWDRVMTINLKSAFLACKYALPGMIAAGGGSVINIGSMSSMRYTGVPYTVYATTKGAIPAFTRAVAMQYAQHKIRANCIHPGIIDTPMMAVTANKLYFAKDANNDPAALRKAREAKIPLKRYGTPFDIASAAVFLASDESSYITGTEIVVDGGFICTAG